MQSAPILIHIVHQQSSSAWKKKKKEIVIKFQQFSEENASCADNNEKTVIFHKLDNIILRTHEGKKTE